MNIANQIPQMEMKADAQSQAWARSARTVLALTCDSILDTISLANDVAKDQGKGLFCLPPGTQLTAEKLDLIIQQAYNSNSSQPSDKNKMSVSKIALISIAQQYPCYK